ncbi:PIG-L deacetylase family protein [Atopomonas sediminilitoris]|uniref:PIG-L deacetylase family protein n=1 Tax=Atopomonas sediminilitoris TaxID=2919919 RepID=UPI001F4E359F|nr:PIG-L family deacetylase [Atopomonas sediminilitoris]MCJ8170306.1 PIG-L family deacetylase [Atopomonas sediminilitoris]
MHARKQQLLQRHRRHRRLALAAGLPLIAVSAVWLWWLPGPLLLLAWLLHEAYFADHLFYSPRDDYRYQWSSDALAVRLGADGSLGLAHLDGVAQADTLLLELRITADWRGRLLDPAVLIETDDVCDVQTFERGCAGVRVLNLSGMGEALAAGRVRLRGHYCRLAGEAKLYVQHNADYAHQRMLILAPHADDAELAAFAQYQRAQQVQIVTLTVGELEAENYQALGLDRPAAAQLKARLRTWDSRHAASWGGVSAADCFQLGYFCMQLPAMRAEPLLGHVSQVAELSDIRPYRQGNALPLPGDVDGQPSWFNLLGDLRGLIEHYQPQVVVTPHPQLDPHADHQATTAALFEALSVSTHQPKTLLYYANHLHDNDRWPMGEQGHGVALPPALEPLSVEGVWSPCLSPAQRLDKHMALGLMHDLQGALPWKKRLRRLLQWGLAARRWPSLSTDEFYRKAVRRHELFFVHPWRGRQD